MKNCLRVALTFLLLTGAVTVGLPVNQQQGDIEPAQSYELTSVRKEISADGKVKILYYTKLYSKSSGEWRSVSKTKLSDFEQDPFGRDGVNPIRFGNEQGSFVKPKSKNERRVVSAPTGPDEVKRDHDREDSFHSHQYLATRLSYTRTEQIAGLVVYIQHKDIDDPNSTVAWQETGYSPKIGSSAVKMIIHYRDGSEMRIEPIKAEFKDLPTDLNDDVKTLEIANK